MITSGSSASKSRPPAGLVRPAPLRIWIIRKLSWLGWRYRYLGMFAIIGFLSICIEVLILLGIGRLRGGPDLFGSAIGFVTGVAIAFYGNYRFNFRVERRKFWRTLFLFALISCCSFGLSLLARERLRLLNWESYPTGRFVTSGCLFLVAYSLHRRFTFRSSAKDFGLAVYAAQGTDVGAMYQLVGEHCDHIHLDLVDESFKPDAAQVDLEVIARARQAWTWQPFMLHVMSRHPKRWVEACLMSVDVLLLHIDGDDDIMSIIADCRLHGKSPGVVAHHTVTLAQLMPFLPHVDFVLVLGIDQPGNSGQPMMPSAIALAQSLAAIADRYGFRLIFDGGVTIETVARIPADFIVSSSTVLRAEDPIRAALSLMTAEKNVRT